MTGILIKNGGNLDADMHTHTGIADVTMKAEIGMIISPLQECQGSPANHQKLREKHGTDSLSLLLEGTDPANTLILDIQPLER